MDRSTDVLVGWPQREGGQSGLAPQTMTPAGSVGAPPTGSHAAADFPRHMVWSQRADLSTRHEWAKSVIIYQDNDHSQSQSCSSSSQKESSASHDSQGPRAHDTHKVWDTSNPEEEGDDGEEDDEVGSEGPFPSVGSSLHHKGTCQPCFFAHAKQGCHNGAECQFCHFEHKRKNKPKPSKKKRDRVKKVLVEKEMLVEQDPLSLPDIVADLPPSIQSNPALKSKMVSRLESLADVRRSDVDEDGRLPEFGVQARVEGGGRRSHIVSL